MPLPHVLPLPALRTTVRQWLQEDMPSLDVGGAVVGDQPGKAQLYMKSPGVVAGVPFVDATCAECGLNIEWKVKEGSHMDISSKQVIAIVTGPLCQILQAERTLLCTLSRCSGVATAARRAQQAVSASWQGTIAGTRKTTPGFRIVEKYGLLVGGVATHRLDLSQMVMLKDNHVNACGGDIATAVARARQCAGFSQKIEVECGTLEQARQAAAAGADICMLDNFEASSLKQAAATLKQEFPNVLIEASGGITLDNTAEYCSPHVDIISQGALTQGYACLDYSLKVE